MVLALLMFAASLSRAEIIARMRAPVLTKVQGLVQVVADCPADVRREYQSPIASFAAGICTELYRGFREQPRRFAEPAVCLTIGEGRTNDTRVVVRVQNREGEPPRTRLFLPAPGSTDLAKLRTEIVKAFMRAVKGKELSDAEADAFYRDLDPVRRAADEYATLERWKRGEKTSLTDEEALTLMRKVLQPGVARAVDVLTFASRLRLYPPAYGHSFSNVYPSVTFAQAIDMAAVDPRVRFAAYAKAPLLVAYSGGRSPELAAAGRAYSDFLFELARFARTKDELHKQLEDADIRLNVALEEARKAEKGTLK